VTMPDFYSMHARKLLGLPDEWHWFSLEAKDGGGGRRFTLIKGAIPLRTISRGPRKGQWDWSQRKDEREVIVSDEEHRAFVAAWELETGKCATCGGSGHTLARWSSESGAEYRPCWKCAAGRAAAAVAEGPRS
jgi:hypothetical protein